MVDSAARLKVAARANVPPFHVMDLLAASNRRQETHGDLLNLVAGQPSTGAPQPVVAEAKRLLDADVLGYTVASGVLPCARRSRSITATPMTSTSPPTTW